MQFVKILWSLRTANLSVQTDLKSVCLTAFLFIYQCYLCSVLSFFSNATELVDAGVNVRKTVCLLSVFISAI